MTMDKNGKDVLKAVAVLAIGWTGLVMLMKGLGEGRDLLAVASVFVLLLAFGMAKKFEQDELDKKSGLDKAVKDELEEKGKKDE